MLQDVLPRDRNKFNKPVFKIRIFETFFKNDVFNLECTAGFEGMF